MSTFQTVDGHVDRWEMNTTQRAVPEEMMLFLTAPSPCLLQTTTQLSCALQIYPLKCSALYDRTGYRDAHFRLEFAQNLSYRLNALTRHW